MGRRPRVTRDEVLATARQAFAERGFDGTTLTAIAARVGVSPAALLRHAPTKDALFAAAMTSGEKDIRIPMDSLAGVPGTADPRLVLRRLALEFIPFVEERLRASIVSWMREQATPSVTIALFDPSVSPSPPQRALALLTAYFRRAIRARRLRVRDPQAAALAFIASLQGYAFLHGLMKILDPPIPLELYVDTVLDIWEGGALRPGKAPDRRRA